MPRTDDIPRPRTQPFHTWPVPAGAPRCRLARLLDAVVAEAAVHQLVARHGCASADIADIAILAWRQISEGFDAPPARARRDRHGGTSTATSRSCTLLTCLEMEIAEHCIRRMGRGRWRRWGTRRRYSPGRSRHALRVVSCYPRAVSALKEGAILHALKTRGGVKAKVAGRTAYLLAKVVY